MGQIKHKMGKVGGGVDISHKSKMSGKAKSLMSFPGGMPGPGEYGQMEQPAKIVGKGMARYLAGESVGMKKYDDAPAKTKGKKGGLETAKKIKKAKEAADLDKKLERGPSGKLYAKSVSREKRLSEMKSEGMKKTDPVIVKGDKSKVNNKVTKTDSRSKKIALLKEKKAIKSAQAKEKIKEKRNMIQVRRDLEANKRNQKKRKRDGKDYQSGTGTDNQKTVRRS